MKSKYFILPALLLFFPLAGQAAGEYVYNVTLLPESLESALELINLIIAVVAAAFAIKLAA